MLSIIGFIIAIFLLVYIVFKGWNIFWAAMAATFVIIFTSGLPFAISLTGGTVGEITYTGFFPGVASFFSSYLGKILFGAIFAQVYAMTGAGTSIAKGIAKALFREKSSQSTKQIVIVFIVLASSLLLTYGGLGAVLCLFIVWPILVPLYEQVDIPRKFAVANMMFGSITLANCGPGAPVVPNVTCGKVLGTVPMAGAVPGFICMAVEIVLMLIIFNIMINKAKASGEHFTMPASAPVQPKDDELPNFWLSLIPMVVTLVLYAAVKMAIEVAILIGFIVALVVLYRSIPKTPTKYEAVKQLMAKGFATSLPTTAAMAGIQGFSAVFKSASCYKAMIGAITGMTASPVVLVLVMVGALSCILAANATALVVALPILQPIVEPLGMSMNALARISCFTGSVLDTVPWSGTINLAAAMSDTTVKEDYPSIFMATIVVPAVGVALMCIMYAVAPGMF